MKRKLALLLACSLIVGMFAACSSGGATTAGETPTPAAETPADSGESAAPAAVPADIGDKTELQFWHYFSLATYDNMAAQVEAYNSNPDSAAYIVEQYIPRNDLLKKYTLGVVSGDLPDLGMVDNPDAATYAAMGMFYNLDDLFGAWDDNQYLSGPLESGKYNGSQYTLPIRSNCLAVWVNNAMFEEAGITDLPETWDEFEAVCEQLKNNLDGVYPFAFCAIKNEEATFQYIPFLYSAGGNISEVNSPQGIRALTFVSDLVKNGYVSAEAINWTQNDVEKQFAAGSAAMMFNGCWHISNMATDAPDLEYSIIYLPKEVEFASCMGGENLGITSKVEDIAAAWDFTSWWLGKEQNVAFNVQVGTISPHSDVSAEEQYPGDEVMQKFIDQLAYAVPRGPSAQWGELSTAVQEMLQSAISGTKTPEEAANEAQEKIANMDI